jgi:hypothetical protein
MSGNDVENFRIRVTVHRDTDAGSQIHFIEAGAIPGLDARSLPCQPGIAYLDCLALLWTHFSDACAGAIVFIPFLVVDDCKLSSFACSLPSQQGNGVHECLKVLPRERSNRKCLHRMSKSVNPSLMGHEGCQGQGEGYGIRRKPSRPEPTCSSRTTRWVDTT